ncbi:hypothetical protein [Actinokineospora globicatena]|uniref:Winged helix DNA-binding domain-containing protein n=1 Tax=Actinokineospora globicatena TaxID=103729 RepID=A0A9W6QL38_9PSEU|nr:hypothetical protein [Actinokineospora globicatena]MCP2303276.1 hypothetical protein [Actinokineospora globicatena]GLW79594.1 hypothetical protein Aglo01_40750 [Actinokineospora globicatena]GLW85996.1 hypothetical protein Aglo02_36360 [Actinokineospora globicatena]GLW90208.1 hypothetical protein Aglo03_10240 [Actinokineospora globicatena]
MTDDERRALRHAAEGAVLFHSGLWGVPTGFLWAGPDGGPAGRVPQWVTEALTVLERRGLVVFRVVLGTKDVAVRVTEAGLRALGRKNTA